MDEPEPSCMEVPGEQQEFLLLARVCITCVYIHVSYELVLANITATVQLQLYTGYLGTYSGKTRTYECIIIILLL